MMEQDLDLVSLTPELKWLLRHQRLRLSREATPGHQPEQDGLWLALHTDSRPQRKAGGGKASQSWPSGSPRAGDQVVTNQVLGLPWSMKLMKRPNKKFKGFVGVLAAAGRVRNK